MPRCDAMRALTPRCNGMACTSETDGGAYWWDGNAESS